MIFELGGGAGYSAKNFLRAVDDDGEVYTCDINPVPKLAQNHHCILKDARDVQASDVNNKVIELIVFDCHLYQMQVFLRFRDLGLIDSHTVLALHDTNTHPYKSVHWAYPVSQGYVHQAPERKMVNDFVDMGYHAFCLHTRNSKHSPKLPYRHGVTVMTKFVRLET